MNTMNIGEIEYRHCCSVLHVCAPRISEIQQIQPNQGTSFRWTPAFLPSWSHWRQTDPAQRGETWSYVELEVIGWFWGPLTGRLLHVHLHMGENTGRKKLQVGPSFSRQGLLCNLENGRPRNLCNFPILLLSWVKTATTGYGQSAHRAAGRGLVMTRWPVIVLFQDRYVMFTKFEWSKFIEVPKCVLYAGCARVPTAAMFHKSVMCARSQVALMPVLRILSVANNRANTQNQVARYSSWICTEGLD